MDLPLDSSVACFSRRRVCKIVAIILVGGLGMASFASVVQQVSTVSTGPSSWSTELASRQTQVYVSTEEEPALLQGLIHIVHTRFMQHQADLKHLSRARLEQLKSVSLPSILHQNSTNFLWIIKTDPDLDKNIRQELVDLLRPHPRFFLVDSLDNYHEWLTNSNADLNGSWRGGEEGEELLTQLSHDSIHTGDRSLLQRAYELREEIPVLETMLDADDGLHDGFIDTVQTYAQSEFGHSSPSRKHWMYWCSRDYIAWHTALNATSNDPEEGLLKIISRPLSSRVAYCSTAGLTVGYNVGTMQVTATAHNHLKKATWYTDCNHDPNVESSCLQVLNDPAPGVVRSRTITSAGMKDVEPVAFQTYRYNESVFMDIQAKLWRTMEETFHISKSACEETNRYIRMNLREIADDNLKGQCSSGHSCKSAARNKLNYLASGQSRI